MNWEQSNQAGTCVENASTRTMVRSGEAAAGADLALDFMFLSVMKKSSAAQLSGSENFGTAALSPHLSMGLPLTED
jgi:hypothetical protein